ncbi:hypothetical protein KGY73_00115 [bacterium]|nr:hypothetical protein [bacterium]
MKLLLYASTTQPPWKKIQEYVKKRVSYKNLELYQTIEALKQRLCQPKEEMFVGFLLVSDREGLLDILSLRQLFLDIPTILIIPDKEKETIALAHRFRPNFLGFKDDEPEKISQVLEKMLG